MKGLLTNKIKSLYSTYELKIIPWSEYQKGIADHWNAKDPSTIPIYNNPYGIIDMFYVMINWEMIYFPCAFYENDVLVGYISIYNLNSHWIRPRGIYILPEFRGRGLGYKMQAASYKLFPEYFDRAFIITSIEKSKGFIDHAGMRVVPDVGPLFSKFSNQTQLLLTVDIAKPINRHYFDHISFLEENREKYSLGGTNNLNVDWDWKEWKDYYETHKGDYPKVKSLWIRMAADTEWS
jgi:GNAT superfamily N-acetyltransferase